MRCEGSETAISQCQSGLWGEHDCDEREAAGVFCDSSNYSVPIPTIIHALPAQESLAEGDEATMAAPRQNEGSRRNRRRKVPVCST